MASEGALSFSVASILEDVLLKHGTRSSDLDLESRKAEEAASRRHEAAGWLRKTVGVVAAKDLPAEPTEEEFRLALRSGRILCNVINKIQPGAVPKVVESHCDSVLIPDGAALSAFQYFENVRNFLVAAANLGIPTFEASDLEQGGMSSRVVNCVLALKSYTEWKQMGGHGIWKSGGNFKSPMSGKTFFRARNSEPFTNKLSGSMSTNGTILNASSDLQSDKMHSSRSLSMLVQTVLLDRKAEEVPALVESVLSKVVEKFEHHIASQNELRRTSSKEVAVSTRNGSSITYGSNRSEKEHKSICDEEAKVQLLKRVAILDRQQNDIQAVKHCLHITRAGMDFIQRKFQEEFYDLSLHVHALAQAASGYNKVLEENRMLYNQVQDLKGSIRVYCRVRPFLAGQPNSLCIVHHIEEGNITINTSSMSGKGHRSFSFNKVFGPFATQEEVFSDTQPLIRSVLDGYNVCIFAYGQTGSGKTYTMVGPKEFTEQNQGVNYRALRDLFFLAEQRKDIFHYEISVQMIEIYNEHVRDLLVTDGPSKRLEIRNNSQTRLNVPDANLFPVSSTPDVISLMNLGQRNRAVGATALNDRSSRSHSCLTVHVEGRDLTSGTLLHGCLHLVDLAGSERVDKSEAAGERLKEAQHINRSLSALGDVMFSLAQKNPHVPYRNSKLTQLLQDSLGGQAKTLMFAHISPEATATGETISTLKFAERVATVELGAARVNKDNNTVVKELKEQIVSLRAALARKEGEPAYPQSSPCSAGAGKCTMGSRDLSPSQIGEVYKTSLMRPKSQSIDLEELLGNPPYWPVSSPDLSQYGETNREMGSGEWVDKVMVNRQDALCPRPRVSESYSALAMNSRFGRANANDSDDVDTGTTDSSEPDLVLQQLNQTTPFSMANGVASGTKCSSPMLSPWTKSPTSKKVVALSSPSPSLKVPLNGTPTPQRRTGRQQMGSGDDKRRGVNRRK